MPPTEKSIPELIDQILNDVRDLQAAFAKDEHGKPDYFSHRSFHTKAVEDAENTRNKKTEITSNIVTWIIVGIISAVAGQTINMLPGIFALIGK